MCGIILFILTLSVGCHCEVLTKYFSTCNRDAANLKDCLKESVEEAVAKLADGAPHIGFEPIDPLFRDAIQLNYRTPELSLKVSLINVTTKGLKETKIKAVNFSRSGDEIKLQVNASSKELNFEGKFKVDGYYNTLELNYRGRFDAHIYGTNQTWDLRGATEERDGLEYCRITHFNIEPNITLAKFNLSHFYPDNPELVKMANGLGNQNWRALYERLRPHLFQQINHFALSLSNKVFLAIPFDQIFTVNSATDFAGNSATDSVGNSATDFVGKSPIDSEGNSTNDSVRKSTNDSVGLL